MNILLISNGVFEYDGRLRELILVSKLIGDTTYITRSISAPGKREDSHIIVPSYKLFSYLRFVIMCVKIARKGNIDLFFADNRKSAIPVLILMKLKRFKRASLIQDARELYIASEAHGVARKIGSFFEKLLMKKADVVICANEYRAKIMKEIYSLKDEPLIFENIRKLYYTSKVSQERATLRYEKLFENRSFRIISTSGCLISRTSEILVRAMESLGDEYELFLVGDSPRKDVEQINKVIRDLQLSNVTQIGKVGENELKFIISNAHLGVVNYHQNDTNNKYCASGKLYEFLFEGIPVVCTNNPPLKDICERHVVGVTDSGYENGIRAVKGNYSYYKGNVKKYIETIDPKVNNSVLAGQINNRLQSCYSKPS